MTDTLTEIPVEHQRIARPDAAFRSARRRRIPPGAADAWRAARTVLVARPAGERAVVTVPRLVIPIGDDQIAFGVSPRSQEAEQLAYDGRVLVQPGDWRGTPALGSHQRQGRAQLVTAGTLLPYVQSELAAKYRWRMPLARLVNRLSRRGEPFGDAVVLVTVDEPNPLPTDHRVPRPIR